MRDFDAYLNENRIILKDVSYDSKSEDTIITASVIFKRGVMMIDMMEKLKNSGLFDSVDIYPVM